MWENRIPREQRVCGLLTQYFLLFDAAWHHVQTCSLSAAVCVAGVNHWSCNFFLIYFPDYVIITCRVHCRGHSNPSNGNKWPLVLLSCCYDGVVWLLCLCVVPAVSSDVDDLGLTSVHPSIKCGSFTLHFVLLSALGYSTCQWNKRPKRSLEIRYSLQRQFFFCYV